MQEKLNLQKIKDVCSKIGIIHCPEREEIQNETYEDLEETWGYKSIDFVNVGGNKSEI